MPVKPIPDGYHAVTPYLSVTSAQKVIDFLRNAFGAELAYDAMKRPDGKIMHADLKIGDSHVMIADENEWSKAQPSALYLYVPDVDQTYQRAVKAGAESTMEPDDMFYGDRIASVKDPAGNSWTIATHKEDVSVPELKKRAEAFHKQHKTQAA
jgi:PhnB protein